jgi:hypothetical protein
MNKHIGRVERGEEPLRNPNSKYPRPPFKTQSQPWPGRACNMDPRLTGRGSAMNDLIADEN